ncbi:MAG: M48 family metallopeptidase, partial [Shewanella sp.]
KASGGQQPPELLSTHPSHSTRIADLTRTIATLPVYQAHPARCVR